MKAKSQDRLRYKVGLMASYLRAFDSSLRDAPRDDLGRQVIVPCLLDDSVHDAVKLVRQAGSVGLIVAARPNKKGFVVKIGQMSVREVHDDDTSDCDLPVGPDCTLDHLFGVMAPGASMTLTLAGEELLIGSINEQSVDKPDLIDA